MPQQAERIHLQGPNKPNPIKCFNLEQQKNMGEVLPEISCPKCSS